MKRSYLTTVALLICIGLGFQVYAEKNPHLPPPFETPSISNHSIVIGWKDGEKPEAPPDIQLQSLRDWIVRVCCMFFHQVTLLYRKPIRLLVRCLQITIFKMNGSELVSQDMFVSDLNYPFDMVVYEDEF